MPPKLKRGVPPGVPPPNGGATLDRPTGGGTPPNDGAEAVNIDRRLKLTADAGVSESIGGAICDGTPGLSSVAPPLGGGTPEDVSFVETNGATEQLSKQNNYLASLSELEQRVCSIARDHLESSFDLSRSSGFIAWAGKK
jgi:hypothetical protein